MFQHRLPVYKYLTNTGIQVFKYFIHGNFFMGLCGLVWLMASYLIVTDNWANIHWQWAISISLGIVGVYNGARVYLLTKSTPLSSDLTENQNWCLNHYQSLMTITGLTLSLGLILLYFLSWEYWLLTGICGVLIIAYYWSSIIPGKRGIRHFGWLKNLVIGVVWALLTGFPPMLNHLTLANFSPDFLLLIERALFIYLLMIPFDIKDIDADQKTGVKTIPAFLGIQKSKWFIVFIQLILLILYCWHYESNLLIAHILSLVYLSILLLFLHPQRSSTHFLVFWDGAIFLQGLLVIIFTM